MNLSQICENFQSLNIVSAETKFVVSTIAYVPVCEELPDSSDEEEDGTFDEIYFNGCLCPECSFFPFTTERPKRARKSIKFKNIEKECRVNYKHSSVIDPFLKNLLETGCEENDKHKMFNKSFPAIMVSIGLNRMRSLSARKNKSLEIELNSKVDTNIRYESFGFLWDCGWYSINENECVPYRTVEKYYKQLKRISPDKAKQFRQKEERNIDIPFQYLREYAKNHTETKKLVEEANSKVNNVYLSLIDIDTFHFNGIYSAYLRVVEERLLPTVMSTRYIYPYDNDFYGSVFTTESQHDRNIRYIIAQKFHLGVYYPEPNTCILIQQGCDTINESFINIRFEKGNLESVCLLLEIQKLRENATFVFSNDNPLITTLPARAKHYKKSKNQISFTTAFRKGFSPTKKDLKHFKQITQSHLNEYVRYTNLFRDPCIVVDKKIKKNASQHCMHLLSLIAKAVKEGICTDIMILELKQYISPYIVDLLFEMVVSVNEYIKNSVETSARDENEQRFLDVLKREEIEICQFSCDAHHMIIKTPVLDLVENGLVDLRSLLELDVDKLKYICYDKEITDNLKSGMDFYSLLRIFKEDYFSDFMNARNEYSISEISEKCEENYLHLKFMAQDPVDIVYDNFDVVDIVRFGRDNNYIDEEDFFLIRGQLSIDDVNGYAAMIFEMHWGYGVNSEEET